MVMFKATSVVGLVKEGRQNVIKEGCQTAGSQV